MSLTDFLTRVLVRRTSSDSQNSVPRVNRADPSDAGLTIVTPTFEGHYEQFARLIESVREHCRDPHLLTYVTIVEAANVERFRGLFADVPFAWRIMTTEEALAQFGVAELPTVFLKRVGKFTFQTLKKFLGLYHASTRWSLVLDSETTFIDFFSVHQLVEDYARGRYIFYSRTEPRGADWHESTGHTVNICCASALSMRTTDRWYMEYFHWFYETDKLRDMIDNHLSAIFYKDVQTGTEQRPYFELILYYMYLEKVHNGKYRFIDIFDELKRYLPPEIARRYQLSELPFSRFGNEYLLNVMRPEEVHLLAPLFEAYRLPFIRLEPPFLSPRYLPEIRELPSLCALVSSQHVVWMRNRIAVCVTDGFSADAGILHAQLRELVGYLSGVECDIFVDGGSGLDEEAILAALSPVAAQFGPLSIDTDRAINRITERSADADRDTERLKRLASADRCFGLIANPESYGHVVILRPGLVGDLSLKEIMIAISDHGDVLPDAIYLPRALHGHGVNLDMALGTVEPMRVYAQAARELLAQPAAGTGDVQLDLLARLVGSGLRIVLAEMAYSDVGHELPRIDLIYRRFHEQFARWEGRNEDAPLYEDVTAHFAGKLVAAGADRIARASALPPIVAA